MLGIFYREQLSERNKDKQNCLNCFSQTQNLQNFASVILTGSGI